MSASTKKDSTDGAAVKKSVQLIVFAPVNADPEDDSNRIYMVCPASLKVVEVVEKYDDDAINYLSTLGSKLKKSEIPPKQFDEEIEAEFDGEIEVAGEIQEEVKEILKEDETLTSLEEELEEDILTFAGGGLNDIFPDDGDPLKDVSDIDMAEAISLLDQEEDESDLRELVDFVDDEELPEL